MVSLMEMPQTVSTPVTREAPPPPPLEAENMIEIADLDFAYGTNHVLHDITLAFRAAP